MNKASRFLNSSLGLALVGFVFTGVLGSFLTFYWHKNEFIYKARLEYEYSLAKAHSEAWRSLYSKIFDQTSKYIVACQRVISIYEYSISNGEQIKEIFGNFSSVSNEWFRESAVVRSQLKLIFLKKVSAEIERDLANNWQKLVDASNVLYAHMAELVTQYDFRDKSPQITKQFSECQRKAREFEELVYYFGNHLISSIF